MENERDPSYPVKSERDSAERIAFSLFLCKKSNIKESMWVLADMKGRNGRQNPSPMSLAGLVRGCGFYNQGGQG